MNKRQRKKARRKQIRIYTRHGAIPGPFRTMRQAIRCARRRGESHVLRYEYLQRTIHWSERVVRGPAMWCTQHIRVLAVGVVRTPFCESIRRWACSFQDGFWHPGVPI